MVGLNQNPLSHGRKAAHKKRATTSSTSDPASAAHKRIAKPVPPAGNAAAPSRIRRSIAFATRSSTIPTTTPAPERSQRKNEMRQSNRRQDDRNVGVHVQMSSAALPHPRNTPRTHRSRKQALSNHLATGACGVAPSAVRIPSRLPHRDRTSTRLPRSRTQATAPSRPATEKAQP